VEGSKTIRRDRGAQHEKIKHVTLDQHPKQLVGGLWVGQKSDEERGEEESGEDSFGRGGFVEVDHGVNGLNSIIST
jgi:hypothetical protein